MTQNSWNSTIPVEETKGGTNQSTYTTGDILYASASNTLSKLAVGTNTHVLTLTAGLPSWAAFSAGVTSGGSSTDNAIARWDGTGGTVLQNSTVIVSDNGEMTNASQPAFLAYLSSTNVNVTGNNTAFNLGNTSAGGTALTEIFDQNADFTTSSASGAYFTAPVTGRYLIQFTVGVEGLTASMTNSVSLFVTSNRTYRNWQYSAAVAKQPQNTTVFDNTIFADMDSADTCYFTIQVIGGTKVADAVGVGSSTALNFVSAKLVC
jgi:hypothetical protein